MFFPRIRLWRALCFAAVSGAASACAGGGHDAAEDERLDVRSASILDGTLAPDATSVVGVVNFAGGQCSGSLIAPNLVLTARHCIAASEDDTTAVVCDETSFEAPDSAGAVFVVPLPEISENPADYHAVSSIRVPEGKTSLCGSDVALLELAASLALPTLTPRSDSPLLAGELYSAVGYGLDGTRARGASGIRRQLDGLQITCVGDECGEDSVLSNEWVGPRGACSGDSGGPALDAEGRVIGVLSRGKGGCLSPVYADVVDYSDWLRTAALDAAQTGHYHAPDWACPDCAPEQEKQLASSCAFGLPSLRASCTWPSALAVLVAVCALQRRRRRA